FVLPCPLAPTSTEIPGSSSKAAWSQDRKSVTSSWRTYIRRTSVGSGGLHGVTTELLAQRRHRAHRRGVGLAGGEPGEQRRGDHRRGYRAVDRFFDSPAALAC